MSASDRCDDCARAGRADCPHLNATDQTIDTLNQLQPGRRAGPERLGAAIQAATDPHDQHDPEGA